MKNMMIKVCTSNIRYENESDGIHHWKNRLPHLSRFFNSSNFHIIGTQEGLETQIKTLANQIDLKLVESHRQWIKNRMYPALFYNDQYVELISSGDFWLSETPNIPGSFSFQSAFPRLATWMKIKILNSTNEFLIINIHLDHVLESTRKSQAQVLIEQVKLINVNKLPIILMGDFNDSPKSQTYLEIINGLDLVDPWSELKIPEESSHHAFKGIQTIGNRIDWILTSKNFECETIYLNKEKKDEIFLSDHFPLVATLIPKCK